MRIHNGEQSMTTVERESLAPPSRALELMGVLLLIVVALFYRHYLNNAGSPPRVFPRTDEVHYVLRVMGFFGGVWDDRNFINPSLYLYLLYGVTWLLGHFLVLGGGYESFEGFAADAATNPYLVVLVGRSISITLAVASVLILYLIARRMFSIRVAFVAAAAMAVNSTFVSRAVLAGTESTMVFLVLAFFFAVLCYLDGPTTRKHVICGLLLGLAASTKYNAGIHAIVFVTATLLGALASGRVRNQLREMKSWLGFPVLAAAFLAASPLIAVEAHEFLTEFTSTVLDVFGGFSVGPRLEIGWTYYITSFPEMNNGLTHALLCGAGLVIAIYRGVFRRDTRAVLLIMCILPLYLFYGPGRSSQMRYFQPATPFLLVLGAWAFDSMLRRSPLTRSSAARGGFATGRTLGAILSTVLLLLLLTPHALKSYGQMERSYGRPDGRAEHTVWLQENIGREEFYVEIGFTTTFSTFENHPLLVQPGKHRLRLQSFVNRAPTLDDLLGKLNRQGCQRLVVYLKSRHIVADETLMLRELATWLRGCEYQDEFVQYLLSLERTPILSTRHRRIVWCVFELSYD